MRIRVGWIVLIAAFLSPLPARAQTQTLVLEGGTLIDGTGKAPLNNAVIVIEGSRIKASFDTLVEAGYQPEIAYFECCHELKLIVDLIYQGGLSYMRYSVSDTAEHGDYTGGPRIVTDATRKEMKKMLEEIRSGEYARKWIAEHEAGRPWFNKQREAEASHLIEDVGGRLRALMPFLRPVKIQQSQPVGS